MNENEIASAYLESIAEELDAVGLLPSPTRPAGFGITVAEFMKAKNVTEGPARKALAEAVKRGLLVVHVMLDGPGAGPKIYCRPNEWPPK